MKLKINTLDQKGMIGDFFIVTAMIAAVGFAGYMIYKANNPTSNTKDSEVSGISDEEKGVPYPDLYQQYKLPEYPDAKITYISDSTESLDGLSITAETADSLDIVGKFYEDGFAKLNGWAYSSPNSKSPTLYGARATKADENLVYDLTITKFSGNTIIRINISRDNND